MIFSKFNTPIDFYVYLYLREDGSPYYVGKGTGNRAWKRNKFEFINPKNERIMIVAHRLSEEEAFILEMKLISEYGRKDNETGILRNKTDGGEGVSGRLSQSKGKTLEEIHGDAKASEIKTRLKKSLNTTKTKQLKSSITSNLWQNPEYIEKQKIAKNDPEYKKSVGEKVSTILNTPEYQELMSLQRTGNKNPKYDHAIYFFIHDSGIVEECQRYQLQTKYSLNQGKISELVNGKRKSVKGWRMSTS